MTVIPLRTLEDLHDAYTAAAAGFRADPRPERIGPTLDAFRRFHRLAFPTFDTEAAVRECRQRMWAEIAKHQDEGSVA